MKSDDFRIDILEQRWLGDEPDAPTKDLCSHGRIRLTIGGTVISDGTEDYGVSETALALLRTLGRDHTQADPVAEKLVFHGCSMILMMSCPIGIDWAVEHLPNGRVRISDVRRFDTTNDAEVVTFPRLTVEIDENSYCATVTRFAREAKHLFVGVHKNIQDDWDRQQYEQFWQEYEQLLDKFS